MAFSSGGYLPANWMPGTLVVGLLGLTIALARIYPRRPRQLSLLVIGLFGLYALWVTLSLIWAESLTRAWLEGARTFSFLILLVLALVFLTDAKARTTFRYLLLLSVLVLVGVATFRLWSTGNISLMFEEGRFAYPTSYPNSAAALYLISFWPLMWLASGGEERSFVRGAALGLATAVLGYAILTQSRGAIWSLGVTVLIMFVISPARMRLLLYLVVPALLLFYEYPALNQYWAKGPEAIGGGLGARTIFVAALVAGLVGLVLALLERWIHVSSRMKLTFGIVIALIVIGGASYGITVGTANVGGPWSWTTRSWNEFTGQSNTQSESEMTNRVAYFSSAGRVSIWKVAWTEFVQHPVIGVGADNFVFEYDRLRTKSYYKPQQAHSIELQVLSETGLVGGVLAFGAMILALGAIIWVRFSAGWAKARERWLTKPNTEPPAVEETGRHLLPRPSRWGDNPAAYGWEIALVGAIMYWLIHASVDWLWQTAGVAIPVLLFLAAGVASVDAKAEIVWPRWNRWLRFPASGKRLSNEQPEYEMSSEKSHEQQFMTTRRTERHLPRIEKRNRKWHSRQSRDAMLQPPGPLSRNIRWAMVIVSALLVLGVGLPYLSIKYTESAVSIGSNDTAKSIGRTTDAHWLQPFDSSPFSARASIYTSSAAAAMEAHVANATLDYLSLAISSYDDAISKEPADWSLRYQASVAVINLMLAKDYSTSTDPRVDHNALVSEIPGLVDWSALADTSLTSVSGGLPSGVAAAYLAADKRASEYRDMTESQLAQLANQHLAAAKARNPLASQIEAAASLVQKLRGI